MPAARVCGSGGCSDGNWCSAETYEDCIALIHAKGYEIKGETFEDNALKYSSFRPLNKEHFIRGSVKSLGAKYTKERIKARLEKMAVTRQKNATRQRNTLHFPKRKNQLSKTISTALSSTPLMKNLQKIPA